MAEAFTDNIAQSKKCPLCRTPCTDLKVLSCTHTYCKACVDKLLENRDNNQTIRCIVCKDETQIPSLQDTSKLPSKLESRFDTQDNQLQICTGCKSEENSYAVVYCKDCGKYLCNICHTTHSQWKDFIGHKIIDISKISSGKVLIRRYRKCTKHPKEDEECFCSNCSIFVCYKCVVEYHKGDSHRIIGAVAYERSHMEDIKMLGSKVARKCSHLQQYVDFIDEEKSRVKNAQMHCANEISKAFDESVLQLKDRKNELIKEVTDRTERVEQELDVMKQSALQCINQLTTIADRVSSRAVPVDRDMLAIHDCLREELQENLDLEDPDYEQPRTSSKKGKSIRLERSIVADVQIIGNIVNICGKSIDLPKRNSMNALVCTPDGRMAVGCSTGGLEIFSADGELLQTVLTEVHIRGIGFLSDHRCAVLDSFNNITLYTAGYTKLNFKFETISRDKGGFADLTVDGDDQIYVSYREARKIQIFSPAPGGEAISEIPCHGYEPQQIKSYNDSLIVSSISFNNRLRLIDKDGVVKHKLKRFLVELYPAVSLRNTILIASVNEVADLVSIDEYTNELKHIGNLVNDCKIEKPERKWYCLQQYRSGEMAFCTPDNLYIFY